jgi:pimeloyl-ACP methyl ester carboxylesterase
MMRGGSAVPSFDSDGVRIHYTDDGDGPPVVLVHGLTGSAERMWRRTGIIRALVAAGRRVIALDCRGHGESDKPHEAAAYAGTRMSDDVIALMDHLGIGTADLAGYSMGGMIAASLLVRRPERFGRVIIAGVGDWLLRAGDLRGIGPQSRGGGVRAAIGRRVMRGITKRMGNDPDALAAIARVPRGPIDAAKLAHVSNPVLLLVGRSDRSAGMPARLAAAISGARIEKVPGSHITAVVDPAFRRAIVEFLTA